MNQLQLHANGTLFNQDQEVTSRVLGFLGYQIQLASSWTLRSFFMLLERYSVLRELNAFIPEYLKQYQAAPEQNCITDTLDHLELQRTVEMMGYPGPPGVQIYVSLKGIRQGIACEFKSQRLETLLDLPFRLGPLNHVVFGDQMDTFQFVTVFNLFELIDGICWELGFHNMPVACALPR